MDALADAILCAFTYLSITPADDDRADDDCRVLESIAAYLHAATPTERDALRRAVQRAIAGEQTSAAPRPDVLNAYEDFIESILSD